MFHFDYLTENTCSKVISLDLDGDTVRNIQFMSGCDGNLKTIPLLLDGWSVDQIEKKLSGIKIASCDPNYKSPLEEDDDE